MKSHVQIVAVLHLVMGALALLITAGAFAFLLLARGLAQTEKLRRLHSGGNLS